MKIVLATNNPHKLSEFRRCFADSGLDIDLIPISGTGFTGEIIEDGETFEENAYIKAKTLCDHTGMAVIADDSGLCVDALGGAPGVHSARFAGDECDTAANNAKLLKELEGVKDRSARFVCVICAVRPDGEKLFVRGESEGEITYAPRGSGNFGYDPLFYYPPLDKTFAELTQEEKNLVSHRGRAFRLFKERIAFLNG